MKKLVRPIAILAMSILPILTALTSTEKAHRHSVSGFQPEPFDPPPACTLTEGFDNVGNLVGNGWFMQNNSMPLGGTGWYQGNPAMFTSQSGAPNSYIAADFNNGSGAATISNWLLTPTLQLQNGGVLTFWTRTVIPGVQFFPDRLQVRMSTNGASTNVGTTATSVGDFTTLLLDINSTYTDDYPHNWTQYTVTISGLPSATTGRLAFRYFVEDGGPSGTRSEYIGIDTLTYFCPSPTPTPTPILGNYPDTSLPLSADATVTPDSTPVNATRMTVSASTNFKGVLQGNPTTGVVRVTDAHPAGTYTVTVQAFDSFGARATKAFTLAVTTPSTCNPVSFATATNYGTGGPQSVAVGDFNNDGNQDLAISHESGTAVSIFLGDGTGNFSAETAFPTSGTCFAVAVGDFNGDGKQDIASVDDNNFVSILLGNGAGGFGAPSRFTVDISPTSVAVGDFNGDGKQDVVTTNYNTISILLGNGAGGFSAVRNFPASQHTYSLAVGDFNDDGNQDVVVVNFGEQTVSVLFGDGAGNFSAPMPFATGSINSWKVAVGDFNNDGKQDLVVAERFSHSVSVLFGDGAGSFSAPRIFLVDNVADAVAVGDFNGDGNQDIAVSIYGLPPNYPGNVSILLGNGAGNFNGALNFSVGGTPFSIAVGDFNGDGKQDLVLPNYTSNSVSVLLRNCVLAPTSVVSRMTHGSAGTFDINLPVTGTWGIESRTTGRTTNDYTIIVTFPSPVTIDGNPQAQVTAGTGTVSAVIINNNTVTVSLTNVTNAQAINVTLFRVNGGGNLVIPMGVLGGDVNGNHAVNASDVAFAKGHTGQQVNATNFRADVNFNGTINASDVSLVKSYLGTGLP